MPKSRTPWLEEGQEAPDPLEFAAAQAQQASVPVVGTQVPIPGLQPGGDQMAQALMMIAEALATIKASDSGAAAHLASIEKLLLAQESVRPHENLFNPPLISANNPLGERDHPRPPLKCRMFWVGYDLREESLPREEIELLNRMQPGHYRVTKADGKSIPFDVQARTDDAGKLESLAFHFPCKGPDDRQSHGSMLTYLQMCLGESISREDLLAQVAALKGQLAAHARLE